MLSQFSALREPLFHAWKSRFEDVLVYPMTINAWDWLHDDLPAVLRRAFVERRDRPLLCRRGIVKILDSEEFVVPAAQPQVRPEVKVQLQVRQLYN